MLKKLFSRPSYSATLKTKLIDVNDVSYQIRELTVGERTAFQSYMLENDSNQLLCAAWLLKKACAEFEKVEVVDISMRVGPSTIEALSEAIIEFNGLLGEESIEQEVKN